MKNVTSPHGLIVRLLAFASLFSLLFVYASVSNGASVTNYRENNDEGNFVRELNGEFYVYLPLIAKPPEPQKPFFLGLQAQWDGNGYLRGSVYENVGNHMERTCNDMTDADTIECYNYHYYNPDPYGWGPNSWYSYYSVSTGQFKSSSSPGDPSWKWGFPWLMPYDVQFNNGQTMYIDGQPFTVSGPYSGYTAFGQAVQYWRLVNQTRFLYWDGDGDWTQYVHAGDATLWYDAGSTRLLLHSDVLRRYYYQGQIHGDTVQYIDNLTNTNSFSNSHGAQEDIGLIEDTGSNGAGQTNPNQVPLIFR